MIWHTSCGTVHCTWFARFNPAASTWHTNIKAHGLPMDNQTWCQTGLGTSAECGAYSTFYISLTHKHTLMQSAVTQLLQLNFTLSHHTGCSWAVIHLGKLLFNSHLTQVYTIILFFDHLFIKNENDHAINSTRPHRVICLWLTSDTSALSIIDQSAPTTSSTGTGRSCASQYSGWTC